MKRTSLLLAASVAASLSLTALAQPDGPGGREGAPPHRGPVRGPGAFLTRTLDTNDDHELSAAEIAAAPDVLRKLDRNADGIITRDELRPARREGDRDRPADAPPPAKGKGRPPGPQDGRGRPTDPVMLALDADGDGQLSASEIGNAAASLKALDLNHDNKLSRHELHPLPPAK